MRNPAAVCPLGPLLSLPKPPLVHKAQLSLSLPSQTPTNGSSSLLVNDSFSFRIAAAQCLEQHKVEKGLFWLTVYNRHGSEGTLVRLGLAVADTPGDLSFVPQVRHRGDECLCFVGFFLSPFV